MTEINPKILIVDDSIENLKLLGNSLKKYQFNILTATSGKQALALIENKQPDVILLDIMMPNMDGYEVCYNIKSNALTNHIPVIFISALNQPEDVQAGYNIGGSDYIFKPFNHDDLILRVKNQLQIHKREIFNNHCYELYRIISNHLNQIDKKSINIVETPSSVICNDFFNYFINNKINYHFTLTDKFELIECYTRLENFCEIKNIPIKKDIKWNQPIKFTGYKLYNYFIELLINIFVENYSVDSIKFNIDEINSEFPFFTLDISSTIPIDIELENFTINFENQEPLFDSNKLALQLLIKLLNIKIEITSDRKINLCKFKIPLYKGYYKTLSQNTETYNENKLSYNILVIEDNLLNIEYMEVILNNLKMDFSVSLNAKEAFDAIKANKFDLILCDLNLPDMNGIELVNKIRESIGNGIPIVCISGHTDEELITKCLNEGFNDFLTKPFQPNHLEQVLNKHFKKGAPLIHDSTNNNFSKHAFGLQKAKELADNNNTLLVQWLSSFCEIIDTCLRTVKEMENTLVFPKRIKVIHDLRNYSSYFEIEEVLVLINELQALENLPDSSETFRKYLVQLEHKLHSAKIYFYAQLMALK